MSNVGGDWDDTLMLNVDDFLGSLMVLLTLVKPRTRESEVFGCCLAREWLAMEKRKTKRNKLQIV